MIAQLINFSLFLESVIVQNLVNILKICRRMYRLFHIGRYFKFYSINFKQFIFFMHFVLLVVVSLL